MPTTPTITPNGQKLIEFLDLKMYDGSFTNDDLVQFIEAVGQYLNLQTITDYANTHKITYNGAKNHRQNIKIFNVNFIIDNE